MKKKLAAIVGASGLLLSAMSAPLSAGSFGIGLLGKGIVAETDGSETLKQSDNVTNHTESETAFAPSGYIQYTFGDDGFVIGVERIPGEASLGSGKNVRGDWIEDSTSGTALQRKQVAEADLSNHTSIYLETPSFGGFFLKAAAVNVDLTTTESLGTGASYGDENINGVTLGVGIRGTADNGIHVKVMYEYTNYDEVTLKSTGSDAVSTIKGDPSTSGLTVGIGYNY